MNAYKLLKDTPELKAGTIFNYHSGYGAYGTVYEKGLYTYDKEKVEGLTEWFEKIPNVPVFKTENGEDVFEGDEHWFYDTESDNIYFSEGASKISGKRVECKYFKTKEEAKEYRLINKECLSFKEIEQYIALGVVYKVLDLLRQKLGYTKEEIEK